MKILLSAAFALLVVVFFVTLFGDNLKALLGMSADALSGDTTVASMGKLERKGFDSFRPAGQTVAAPPPNATTRTAVDARSTFAIDVDTASWTWARRNVMLERQLPSPRGIRVEEWVNAFDYGLIAPRTEPVAIQVEGAVSPFDESKTLLKVSLKGRVVENREPAHLVFLVDVSGSMGGGDRLPLARQAMEVLTKQLSADDTVAVVTYAGSTEVVLPPTRATETAAILSAIRRLNSGGGTAMGSGMELAYRLAVPQVRPHTTTRVIVLTDGDANIGNVTPGEMLAAVHGYVEEGVTLTTVGFGLGNYRGEALEQLADKGNGQALYVSSLADVHEAFSKNLVGTLQVIAKDVKVQVAFNPEVVTSYRLIGYENRDVADDDFTNDRVDAGEMGSGHAVTALYEVSLTSARGALGTVSVRGLHPDSREVFEARAQVVREDVAHAFDEASTDLRFAAAVALGADALRGNTQGQWSLRAIAELASGAAGGRPERNDFVAFLQQAEALRSQPLVAEY